MECGLPITCSVEDSAVGGREERSGAANNNPLSSQSQVIKTSATRPTLRTLQISFVNNWFQILKSISSFKRVTSSRVIFASVCFLFSRIQALAFSSLSVFFLFRSLNANYTLPAARASLSKGSHVYTCLIVVAEQRGGSRIPESTHQPP